MMIFHVKTRMFLKSWRHALSISGNPEWVPIWTESIDDAYLFTRDEAIDFSKRFGKIAATFEVCAIR